MLRKPTLDSRTKTGPPPLHTHLESTSVLARLHEIARVLARNESRPTRAFVLASPALCRLVPSKRAVERDLQVLLALSRQPDTGATTRKAARQGATSLPAGTQAAIRRELAAALRRLLPGIRTRRLKQRVVANTKAFTEAIVAALMLLSQGRVRGSRKQLTLLKKLEQEARELSVEIAGMVAGYQQERSRIVTRISLTHASARGRR
ncbi:MAG: hypothetical protein ABSE73_00080 [Planctomycetota bacterium]